MYSPEEGRDSVGEDYSRSPSYDNIKPLAASHPPSPQNQHPAEPESAAQFEDNPTYEQANAWSRSVSGSTLTRDKETSDIYDIENEGRKPTLTPGPVSFWDNALKATRRYVFARYLWTCKYVAHPPVYV